MKSKFTQTKYSSLDPKLIRLCTQYGGHIVKRGSSYFLVKGVPPHHAQIQGTYAGESVYKYK